MHVAEAADVNFAMHSSWALRSLPGATVFDDPGLVVTDSGLPCDTFNIVCRARLDPATAAARVAQTVDYFRRAGRGFSWWLGPADRPAGLDRLLMDAGLHHAESETMMSVPLRQLRTPDTPAGLDIRRVRTTTEFETYAGVLAALGSPPDDNVLRFYRLTAPALLSDASPQRFYVGYVDGQAVATAEMTLAGDVAGIYGVVTLEDFRRRGIGSALTAAPLLEARNGGYSTGVLQASAAGAGVYRRLGFTSFGEVREFKPA